MEEKDLVARVKEGDTGSFELLVKLHYRSVYGMAFRYMGDHGGADDVVQDTFVKAHKAIASFRGDCSFKSWILRIAINTAKNAIRSRSRHDGASVDDMQIAEENKGYKAVELESSMIRAKEAIDQLPDKQRTAVELRLFEELSFKEIAEAMDCPFDTAKANYRHGVMKLRDLLKDIDLF